MARVVALFLILAAVMFSSCQTHQQANPPIIAPAVQTKSVEPAPASTHRSSYQPTSTPSTTSQFMPSPTPSPTLRAFFKGPMVAFNQMSESLWLYDLGTQLGRQLTFKEGYPNGVQWTENACQLYVTLVDPINSETSIIRTDLQGNVIDQVFQTSAQRPKSQAAYHGRWSISPAGDWLAFIAFSGEQYYSGSEFQDIAIVKRTSPQEPITLTIRRGGSSYAWSPDGQLLAFVDYDEYGVRQLYVADLRHDQKIRLTSLVGQADAQELPRNNIGRPVWSPNGKLIAVHENTRDARGTVVGDVWLLSANGERQLQIAVTNLPIVSWLGWSDDSATLALYSRPDTTSDDAPPAIYWVHADDGKVVRTLTSSELPELSYSSVFSFQGVQLLGITNYSRDSKSYVYDYQSQSLRPIVMPDLLENLDFIDIVAAPASFPGEEACVREGK